MIPNFLLPGEIVGRECHGGAWQIARLRGDQGLAGIFLILNQMGLFPLLLWMCVLELGLHLYHVQKKLRIVK